MVRALVVLLAVALLARTLRTMRWWCHLLSPCASSQGLASAIVMAALGRQAAPAAAPPAAHAMGAGSIAGSGRQLQAGTGRMAAREGAARLQPIVGQQLEAQQSKPKLDLLSILLAPVAPLLAPRHARKAATADSAHSSINSVSSVSVIHAPDSAAVTATSGSTSGSSEGGASHLEDVLLRLQAAATAPNVRGDPRFAAVCALLAAAPAAGAARHNFALSLVRQLCGCGR